MNPDTNRFEPLVMKDERKEHNKDQEAARDRRQVEAQLQKVAAKMLPTDLVRPDGSPVPQNWSIFTVGELVVFKDYTYRVAYINESSITFEPVGPVVVGEGITK